MASAVGVLAPVGQAIFEEMGQPQEKGIAEALDNRAYASFLALSGELRAQRLQPELWERAQLESDPYVAYMRQVHTLALANDGSLRSNLTRLGTLTAPGLPSNTLPDLALAATMLVQAEAHYMLATQYLNSPIQQIAMQNPQYRYTVLMPVTKLELSVRAADGILDAVETQDPGRHLDAAKLAQNVQNAGGTGTSWVLPSAGPLHDAARHARLRAMSQANATASDLSAALYVLKENYNADQPGAAVAAYAHLDGSWWLGRQPDNVNEAWTPTLTFLTGQAKAADYEQYLLATSLPTSTDWKPWLFAGIGVSLGAAFCLAIALRRRPKRPVATHLVTLLAVILLSSLAQAHGTGQPHNDTGTPAPTNLPDGGPVAVTDGHGGLGNLAIDQTGARHFTWAGCAGPKGPGCMDIYMRTWGSDGTWGPAVRVVDAAVNTTLPKLAWDGSRLHLIWMQGTGLEPGAARELYHCMPTSCTGTMLSRPGEYAVLADIDAFGGRAVAVWHEEHHDQGRVYAAWWTGAWQAASRISDESRLARYPDVVMENSAVAHATWQVGTPGAVTTDREVAYARLGPSTLEGPVIAATGRIDGRTRPTVDVLPSGAVGVAYNGWHDVFLTENQGNGWSAPSNVSRTRTSLQSWPLLTASDGDWLVTWTTGSIGTSHMWQSRRVEGFWLRPEIIVQEPYDHIIILPQAYADGSGLAMVWTGSIVGSTASELYYATWGAEAADEPPAIQIHSPSPQSWRRAVPLDLVAMVSASAALSDATWILDGEATPTSIDQNGNLKATVDPKAGTHTAVAIVRDAQGRTASASVTFTVDDAQPELSVAIQAGARDADRMGWFAEPIVIQASATDNVAAVIQVDYNSHGQWRDVPNGKIALDEGRLHHVRLRAIDPAGNVQIGPPMQLGWDATGPTGTASVAPWSADGARLNVTLSSSGAPAKVHAWSGTAHANTSLSGKLFLPLQDGAHEVHAEARDEAGHVVPLGSWNVSVDSVVPIVGVFNGVLEASDEGSGLSSIVVSGQTIKLEGEPNATVELPDSPVVRIQVTDRAGNVWNGTVDGQTGLIKQDALAPASTNLPEGGQRGAPAGTLGVLAMALAAVAAMVRRRR